MSEKQEITIDVRKLADDGEGRLVVNIDGSTENIDRIVIHGTGTEEDAPIRFREFNAYMPDKAVAELDVAGLGETTNDQST